MTDDMSRLEEQMAHLLRTVDDLSDVVARQDRELRDVSRRVESLLRREAQRDADTAGSIFLGDEKPPHY